MFWNDAKPARPAAMARTRAAHLEQAELWTARPAARAAAAVREEAPAVQSLAKAHTMTRSAARMVPAGQPYAERQQRMRTEDMARLLEANRAVYGRLVPVKAFALPRRSFSAQLNLWKGSKLGTSFVTGC